MKAGTHNHLKVKRLKRLLGIPLYRAVGILETLWLLCIDCCDEGNIGKFTDEEIADYLEWDGDPSALARGLSDSGWLDPHDTERLVVSGWADIRRDYQLPRAARDHLDPAIARHTVLLHLKAARRAGLDASLTTEEWLGVIAEFHNACAYCGSAGVALQLDHMTPSSRGGSTTRANVVPACGRCNKAKGTRTPLEYFLWRIR